jgi:Recombination endonuclease VII
MSKRQKAYFRDILSWYGMSKDEYALKARSQEGHCIICNERPEKKNGKRQRLHVDHDHKTYKVRDLLCTCCNSLLGFSKEDLRTLLAAVIYLWRHQHSIPILSRFILQAQANELLEILDSTDFDVVVLRGRQLRVA